MRADASESGASKTRHGSRLGNRALRHRRSRHRGLALENLENRQLLSTVPAPAQASNPQALFNPPGTGSVNSTMVAIDPAHPNIMVAVFERNDPNDTPYFNQYGNDSVFVQAEISTNGGVNWSTPQALNGFNLGDGTLNPSVTTNVPDLPDVTNPTIAFDAHDNFYILDTPRTADFTIGELLLNRFAVNPGSGAVTYNGGNALREWNSGGSATSTPVGPTYPSFQPVVAADGNQSSFGSQSDPNANVNGSGFGAVYVAYATSAVVPSTSTPGSVAGIYMMASDDGGNTFTGPKQVTAGSFNTGAPYVNAVAPSLTVSQGNGGSVAGGLVSLVWDDDSSESNLNVDVINDTALTYNGTTLSPTGTNQVATSYVRAAKDATGGNLVNPDSASTAVSPVGIGPGAVVTSDNTLGGPFEGRLYVAYVNNTDLDTPGTVGTPVDNTDVFLKYSTDGGQSWSAPVKVDDDNAATDGFSEGSNQQVESGRPQFLPAVAVDPVTGAVAVSYYDARNDPSRARVATYVNVSIDGGNTFSAGNYANASQTTTDAITDKTVNLGPIPDNQSAGNTLNRDTTFGFGDRQGLVFYDGVITPVWASNQNGGSTAIGGSNYVSGWTAAVGRLTTAAGPRVIASTMGPVGLSGDTVNTATNPVDGSTIADAFQVTFDRPIVASSFSPNDVQITYTSPDGSIVQNYTATGVTPNSGTATTFTVRYNPTPNPTFGYVGTYSYKIVPAGQNGSTPQTSISYVNPAGSIVTGEYMNQSANPATAGSASDTYTVTAAPASNELPLIVAGPHVVSMSAAVGTDAGTTTDGIATVSNPSGSTVLVTVVFDRLMNPATIVSSSVPASTVITRIMGPSGPIPLTGVTITEGANAKTYVISIPNQTSSKTQWLSGTYTVTLASSVADTYGNKLDTNLNAGVYTLQGFDPTAPTQTNTYTVTPNATIPQSPAVVTATVNVPTNYLVRGISVGLNITYNNPGDLTAILQGPDGSQVVLFSGVGGPSGNGFNVTLDDTLSQGTPIVGVSGTAGQTITGSFYPQNSLGNTFVTGAYKSSGNWKLILYSSDSSNTFSGTLNSFTLNLLNSVTGTGLGEPIADQYTASFRVVNTATSDLTSTQQWTSIGPAPITTQDDNSATGTASKTGLVGALAVDPSDPSGNTVYAGGASGGVWKTTNFLTTNPNGPVWIPLTDFGPASQINVGTITVVPQKNAAGVYDPTKSIVLVGLGDGDVGSKGTGFLISDDGGATFQEVTGTSPGDTTFETNTTYVWKIAVDPTPNPVNGKLIIYAALGGSATTAGLWKSSDGGNDWTKLSVPVAGTTGVTDVVLDPLSGTGGGSGNLQILYAGSPGSGIYATSNAGASWYPMLGGLGDPLIHNGNGAAVPVVGSPAAPAGTSNGRILLVKPALSSSSTPSHPSLQDQIYEGWLYALVSTGGAMDGLYVTKDYGQNWTKVLLPFSVTPDGIFPSNDPTKAGDYDPASGNGGYNLSFAVDPTNPYVVYIGGGSGPNSPDPGLLRVDITAIDDAHSFVSHNNDNNDGGQLEYNAAGGITVSPNYLQGELLQPNKPSGNYIPVSYLNLIRDPTNVFSVNSTLQTLYASQFNNTGAGALIDTYLSGDDNDPVTGTLIQAHEQALNFSGSFHRIVSYTDPTTGLPRLIFGTDQGVFTGVDNNGTFEGGVDTASTVGAGIAQGQTGPLGSRNGNLALTQYYYGAVQPSAHTGTGVIVYGGAHTVGAPASGTFLTNGNYQATSSYATTTYAGDGNSYGVATDPTGSGTVYRFIPFSQAGTNFFEVQPGGTGPFISRTFGLTTGPTDTQWNGTTYNNGLTTFGNFAVNSVNGNQIVITSNNGTIYRTEDQGKTWFPIGTTADGTYAPAVAYGASSGVGSTDNFIYDGTVGGQISVTTNGGGTWNNISLGLDGSTVQKIIPDPTPGTHDAIAITTGTKLDDVQFPGPVSNSGGSSSFINTAAVPGYPTSSAITEVINVPPPNVEQLQDMSVNLNLSFPAYPTSSGTKQSGVDSDLTATLTAPDGTVFTLFSGVGATSQAGFINTTFNDNAQRPNYPLSYINAVKPGNPPTPLYTAPFTGSYQIQNGVVMLHMVQTNVNPDVTGPEYLKNITGNWTLKVAANNPLSTDNNLDLAQLNSWSINLVSQGGVYYMPDSTNPASFWHNVTGTLFSAFAAPNAGTNTLQTQLTALTSLQADWRYMVPFDPTQPTSVTNPLTPLIYVAGNSGVYRTDTLGQLWTLFPSNDANVDSTDASLDVLPNATGGVVVAYKTATGALVPGYDPQPAGSTPVYDSPNAAGGYLANAQVNDLSIATGNVNPATGRSTYQAGDPNMLVASTYGRGQYMINLAPTVVPNVTQDLPGYTRVTATSPGASLTVNNSGTQVVDITGSPTITVQGYSEQSNYGNAVSVQLYDMTGGTPVLIPGATATTDPNTGKFTITFAASVFAADNIPSTGLVVTLGMQATDQTGAKGNMAPYSFIAENPRTAAPTALVLDSSTDSGTYDNDQYTNFNNANSTNSPLFDVSGVIVPPTAAAATTVILSRASEVNGVVGAFSVVDTQTYTPSQFLSTAGGFGTVQIADTNGGNGAIPDTPVNTPPNNDTAPNQPNQYVYQVSQVDYLNVQSGPYTAPKGVIVDTVAPATPTSVTLDPSTDSGTSATDGYTNFNDSNNNAPLFDVAGIEPHATVELIRTDSKGVATIVNILKDVAPANLNLTTGLGTVQIADINVNNTTIPDSPVGTPINTAPPSGNPYTYSAIQIDLAGNPSGQSQTSFGNKGAIVLDGTDADNHGDFNTTTGQNEQGWLYMQKVVEAIAPNVTDGQKVLVALGADPSISVRNVDASSAVHGIDEAFLQSGLQAQGWSLVYVTGNANITNYLSGQPAAAVDVNDAAAGTVTLAKTGLLYIPTAGHQHVPDDLTDAELGIIDQNGLAILSYVNAGGGLYTQTETELTGGFGGGPVGQTSPAYGWLSSLFPGVQVVPSSQTPRNIQLTAAGQSIFPGLTSADLSGGPWHNYFAGTIPSSLAAMFTDTNPNDPTNPADTVILGLSSVGSIVTAPPTGAQVIIDTTKPLQSVTTLDPSTDSGSLNNDQYTYFNNSSSNPPIFDVTNVEPNGIVRLYRTPGTVNASGVFTAAGAPVLVNTLTQPGGGGLGTMQIPDVNPGMGTIPDGTYLYTNTQTDLAGNLGPFSEGVVVYVRSVKPAAPTKIVLDSSTDSGTSGTDQYTNFNNSDNNAPIFDVYGVIAPPGAPTDEETTVVLLRASEVNGVVGAFTPVDTQTYPASYFTAADNYKGYVQIADTNGGSGTIPDTPVNTLIDTAPNQPNQYVYQAYQTDYVGNSSTPYTAPNGVIVDSTAPSAPTSVTLDPSTDSARPGVTGPDGYTNFNNSNNNAPLFDVTGIEPNATVELFRTDPSGVHTLVNTITYAKPTNLKNGLGTVQIADINQGDGTIADDVAANAVNQAPPAGTPYQYTAIQIDLAGNASTQSKPVFGNSGAVVIDGTDSDFHGSLNSSGTVLNGWFYMEKVLDAIQPNITSGAKTLVALGIDPTVYGPSASNFGADEAIYQSFLQSVLPGLGWKLTYVPDSEMDSYLSGNVVNTIDQTGTASGTTSLGQTGLLYITTANLTGDDMSSTDVSVLDKHGPDIQNYVNGGGGLFTMAELTAGFGSAPVAPYGWLSSLFPGVSVTDVGGVFPSNIQLTTLGKTIFPGLTAADLSTGPWHEYFTLSPSVTALAPVFTDTNPDDLSNPSDTVILGLSSVGTISGSANSGLVTIDSTPPVVPTLGIQPTSVSGETVGGLIYTHFNNSSSNAPVFNAGNVESNGQVNLYRTPGTYAGGVFTATGAPVLVDTIISSAGGTSAIADTNAGNGKISDGVYQYTVQDVDLAGNFLPAGSPVDVDILATPPLAPTKIFLDPSTDTGTYNNDDYTQDNNGNPYPSPLFDVWGVAPNVAVELFRDTVINGIASGSPTLVNTVTAVPQGSNDQVQIADTNAGNGTIPDGVYLYTAKLVNLASDIGPPTSPGTTVTIDTLVPQPNPPAPPILDPASDTGTYSNDQITEDDNSAEFPAPLFHAGVAPAGKPAAPVEPHDTVDLFRAPVNTTTGAVGTPVLVHELKDTAGGNVPITDINAGDGTIPDGTYMYYIRLSDLAGNVGSFSPGLKVVIDTATPAVPSPFHLDASTDTGVSNSDGITQIVQGTHPIFDAGSVGGAGAVLKGATLHLYRAPIDPNTGVVGPAVVVNTLVNVQPGGLVQIPDLQSLPDGKYQYSVQQVDLAGNASSVGSAITVDYVDGQPPVSDFTTPLKLDPSSQTVPGNPNLTSNTSPIFDVTVNLAAANSPAKLTLVRDGVVVNPVVSATQPDQLSYYTVTGGPVTIQDPGPVPFGTHTYQVYLTDLAGNRSPLSAPLTITFANSPPGTITLDPGSDSGVKGDDVTDVAKPTFDVTLGASAAGSTLRLLQGGLTVTTTQVPAAFTGGTIQITEPNALANGKYTFASQLVDAHGNPSPAGPTVTITIDTTPPVAPSQVKLDPASDSGFVGDGVTNFNNTAGKNLQFDASGIIAGATVNLYRSAFNPKTGMVGTPALVDSLTFSNPINGAVSINDVNLPAGGAVPDGDYQYTVQQVSVAGNTSPSSSPVTVTVDTSVPGMPTVALDPASDSGTPGGDVTNVINPYFDVTGVAGGATVSLYRVGLPTPVKTLSNVVVPANGVVKIQDPGPLANGTYEYYAVQTNVAGTNSEDSAKLTIRIDNTPPATPTVPKLTLDVSSDTGVKGDGITSSRLLVLDGSADPGVAINLYDVSSGTPKFLATTNANGTGQFQIALPTALTNGDYKYAATATDAKQQTSAMTSPPLLVRVTTVAGDYNGTGKTELALFRRTAPFYMQIFVNNDAPLASTNFGAGSLDVPVSGDFFGLGVTDPAVYRPSTAEWFAMRPSDTNTTPPSGYVGTLIGTFGAPNLDIPAPGNYSGNNVTQLAVYRPTNGEYFVRTSGINAVPTADIEYKTGVTNGTPAPADYLNSGYDQPAVFKASAKGDTWTIVTGGSGGSTTTQVVHFGGSANGDDVPVPGDYDTVPAYGQLASATYGGAEEAVWQPGAGQYIIDGPTGGRIYKFAPGDIPVPGDYDGLGVTEPAVYRPSTGQWFVYGPNDNPANGPRLLGGFGDAATPAQYAPPLAPYPYRALPANSQVITAGSPAALNFGATAASLAAPSSTPAALVVAPAAASRSSDSAPLTIATAAPRVRPAQATTADHHGHDRQAGHLIDQALAAVKVKRKGHLNDPFQNL